LISRRIQDNACNIAGKQGQNALGPVFITGGAGFVGSHASKAFARAGREVVVYDNLSRGWADFVKWGPLVEGDILDTAQLTAALKQ
jgi:UDP-arabinose 4-epimerase